MALHCSNSRDALHDQPGPQPAAATASLHGTRRHRSAAASLPPACRWLEPGRLPVPARSFLHGQPGDDDPPVSALPRSARPSRRRPQHRAGGLRRFNQRALRDLQVWFNLAWIHPLAFERDADLRALRDKGRYFTEQEKDWLLDKHLEILKQIIRCTASWSRAARSS